MKKLVVVLFLFAAAVTKAQILEPVKWSTSVEKISKTEAYLVATATIDEGWHLYSQDVPEGGPVATTFTYDDSSKKFKLVDKTEEGKGHVVNDKIFEMKIKYFDGKAVFKQKIKLAPNQKLTINGSVEFMVCDDGRCLPPTTEDLKFEL
ncbi:protein-disulfide reductase DsbD N-terminal domain-containing protein [Zhouia spongiae]|uniref:Protein-disulfide reductase DsbD N-terminal domain-containing protein n=1 Tax=Zhouia spongiae TaxID=2202721 RepID=A0ABY3YJZ9_9FLAO|nr:protein-disulfide reductase DsbD domain-containing protein [Zhouia spongiae]UNY97488.1 protein-disulfide reductase DsbD N-terminal domain-containing protein [Zhouia spongiae]